MRGGPAAPEAAARTMRLIWGVSLAGLAAYVGVAALAGRGGRPDVSPQTRDVVVGLFAFVAAALVIVAFALRGVLARAMVYQEWLIVRWAAAESAGVFGVATVFLLGAELSVAVLFIAASALVLVLWRPGAAAEEEYRRLRRRLGRP